MFTTTFHRPLMRFISLLFLGSFLIAGAAWSANAQSERETAVAAPNQFVYLPLVMNPAQAGLVPNGNFESGAAVWVESSSNDYDLIVDSDYLENIPPHGGSWAAWLGGFKNETSTIQQQIIVPLSAPYLAYWHWVSSDDYCGYDVASVRVNGTAVSTYPLCASANTNGWVHKVVNLSAYAGQTVTLEFRVVIDHSLRSDLFIDDVSFQMSAGAALGEVAPDTTLPVVLPPKTDNLEKPLAHVAQIGISSQVTTLAGPHYGADGIGPAAQFTTPYAVSLSSDGSFALIADSAGHTIRHLDLATGQVTTLAGAAGVPGSANGTGENARFNFPTGIALSSDGSFALIGDTSNHTIRRLDVATGQVTTPVGSPGQAGSVNGTGSAARFNYPAGLALSHDGSFVLIADLNNHTIRYLHLDSGTVTTLAGLAGESGNADSVYHPILGGGGYWSDERFSQPSGIALSGDNSLALVTDRGNNTIRAINISTTQVTTLAGVPGQAGSQDGMGTSARFQLPFAVTLSADGSTALVADTFNSILRTVEVATGQVTTLAGSPGSIGITDGTGLNARFTLPTGVSLTADGQTAVITEPGSALVRKLDVAAAAVTTIAGSPAIGHTDGVGPEARFSWPSGVALNADGRIGLIADERNHTIRRIDVTTRAVTTLAGEPGIAGFSNGPGSIARFSSPTGIALSGDGRIALIADRDNHVIRQIDVATGEVTTLAGSPANFGFVDGVGGNARFEQPWDVALNADGSMAIVADSGNNAIRLVAVSSGQVTTIAGGTAGDDDGAGAAAQFLAPRGIALSRDGDIALIADHFNHTIRKVIVATGQVTTLAGMPAVSGYADGVGSNALFRFPLGVTFNGDGRTALVADESNHVIRQIDLVTNQVTTLAGASGLIGFLDGYGSTARFSSPRGIALSADGRTAIITDTANNTIRLLGDPPGGYTVYLPVMIR